MKGKMRKYKLGPMQSGFRKSGINGMRCDLYFFHTTQALYFMLHAFQSRGNQWKWRQVGEK